jgi:hypothetical protein
MGREGYGRFLAGVEPHEVAAGVLGFVQGDVRRVEQRIHGGARRRVSGHPATDLALDQPPLVQDSRSLAPAAQVVGEGESGRGVGAR